MLKFFGNLPNGTQITLIICVCIVLIVIAFNPLAGTAVGGFLATIFAISKGKGGDNS